MTFERWLKDYLPPAPLRRLPPRESNVMTVGLDEENLFSLPNWILQVEFSEGQANAFMACEIEAFMERIEFEKAQAQVS